MEKRIIKCFSTLQGYYFYDRYTNSIVKVNAEEYEQLKEIEENGMSLESAEKLNRLIANNMLNVNTARVIENPMCKDLEYCTTNKLMELILQVTQQCNLRCAYCAYSGNYYNRQHSNKRMSIEVAKKAIDFYIDRTGEMNELSFAFYGGEPLLEFQLIEKCVDYIEKKKLDKKVVFLITTNGTLLTDQVIQFLVKHQFVLTISLDGDQKEHDVNRRFENGKGSHELIMDNLKKLREYNSNYFQSKGTFTNIY